MSDRYARQIVLGDVGADGQARLTSSSVLVVGAGGLGCPVLQYLAGAGVGRMIVVDHDVVEESNLHRQPLYGMPDIGKPKAEAARAALLRFNPGVAIEAKVERLTPQNVGMLIGDVDLVVDAADSFAATYILSDACHAISKPLVSASVIRLVGYVGAFCGGGPSYRAVFPDVSVDGGTCATVGVLGTAVAVLGGLQAHLALHLLLGLEPAALGRVVTFDARKLAFGGFGFAGAPEPAASLPFIAAKRSWPMIWSSICAASRKRRGRRSRGRAVSMSITSRKSPRNLCPPSALSFVAEAASVRSWPRSGCRRVGSRRSRWWPSAERRDTLMTEHTTDQTILSNISHLVD